jgi:hypothetical protein
MKPADRIRQALEAYERSIKTCAYDKREAVLCLLAREVIDGIAGLAEDLTFEDGSRVCDQSEGLTNEIHVMFSDAEDKAEDRRAERAA